MTPSSKRTQSPFTDPGLLISEREKEALRFLTPLSADYPNISEWFVCKVLPGLRVGTRLLRTVERDGNLVGVAIGKLEDDEKKICTVRISPSYAGRGVGVRLFDDLLRSLNTDRPCLSVSEFKLDAFQRIFDWYGFRQTSVTVGRYVPNVAEYSYNGENA